MECIEKNARHKGKQFVTQPSKDVCNGAGYFHKKTYTSDPLLDNTMYSKSQPADSRKLGFGTHDAHRRDEFMSHIRTEQYRETLTREMQIIEQQKKEEDDEDEFANDSNASKPFPKGLTKTTYLYDIGRNNVTEFNKKSHRDRFYTMRTGNCQYERDNGHFVLSSQSIGDGVHSAEYKPVNTRSATTKQFYDHSHLHTGM